MRKRLACFGRTRLRWGFCVAGPCLFVKQNLGSVEKCLYLLLLRTTHFPIDYLKLKLSLVYLQHT